MQNAIKSDITSERIFRYQTAGGIEVLRRISPLEYANATEPLIDALDQQRGMLLSSSFEFPGRYQRWDIGFINPPLLIRSRGRCLTIEALNARGALLLPAFADQLASCEAVADCVAADDKLLVKIHEPVALVYEEARSRQATVFSVLRSLVQLFHYENEAHLGFYGVFGYDLVFQFEAITERIERDTEQQDLLLYLPDELIVVDHQREQAFRQRYDFLLGKRTTLRMPRQGAALPFKPAVAGVQESCDHAAGEFATTVEQALDYFRRGDLFEVVPGQVFSLPCRDSPAMIFRRLKDSNPAPYGMLMNLGAQEYLVAASPEMFVRVTQRQVETCPISGTIARGRNALEDAEQIRTLLNSEKDLAELSMCTDVDRNDKARVCEPGSVQLKGRRQIEMYSRLIHTVDHVEGTLSPDRDALDAFLSHAWAVTVTGAPKLSAMQFIEDHEKSPRRWYGGAMGLLGFNGNMNTGLTLRTLRIQEGIAEIRAGATLLYDSCPAAEEAETRLKASALMAAVRGGGGPQKLSPSTAMAPVLPGQDLQVLMIDHQDSFVHSLAAMFRAQGCALRTVRPQQLALALAQDLPSLVVLSPGPGRPAEAGMQASLEMVLARGLPVFGVCLGLQGIVEYFGGTLRQLEAPVHGRASRIQVDTLNPLFSGIDTALQVGRYHSLAVAKVPACLKVSAQSEDGVVMALEHRTLPVSAVQFHPESILTQGNGAGQRLIANLLAQVNSTQQVAAQRMAVSG